MDTLPIGREHFESDRITQYAEAFKKHHLLVIDRFISPDYVRTHFTPKIDHCASMMHRVKIPNFKKSGSVSSHQLKNHANELFDLYHADTLRNFIEKVVGVKLNVCPSSDPHAVALYYYTEPGDHIGVHYDKSFYKGRRYTVLLGVVQDSIQSNLVCYLGAHKLNRRKNPMTVITHPGTLVIFNGDTLWHEITPLGNNERRVILTMEYVTDNRISKINHWISNAKDRFLYFGNNTNPTP